MQRSDPVEHLFKVFSDAIHELRTDVLDFQMDNNPILSALVRKHSANLFGIWDVWKSLQVEPGDIGYLVRGSDPLRPGFQKLFNVAETAQNDPRCIKLENRHGPEPDAWSSEAMAQGIIRYVNGATSMVPY